MSFRRLIIPTIVAIIVSIVATVVWSASPPPIITYQGKVLVSGSPASTTLPMQFIIYNHPTAGSVLYSASSTPIDIVPTNGLFTVYLGDNGTNPINPEIFKDNDSLYLQVVINGETLSPRKRLAATPYALNTKYLDGNFATSTPTTTKYIPIADVFGNFDLNSVTSTNLAVTGNITATGKISLGTSISDYTLNVGMSSGDLGAFGLFSDTDNYLVGFGNNTSSVGGLDNGVMALYYDTNNIMNPQIFFQASGTSWMSGGMVVGMQGGSSLEENEKLRIFGDINIDGGVLKFNGVSGTPGYVLIVSTTTGLQEWAPTSSLGITGGGGGSLPFGSIGQMLVNNGGTNWVSANNVSLIDDENDERVLLKKLSLGPFGNMDVSNDGMHITVMSSYAPGQPAISNDYGNTWSTVALQYTWRKVVMSDNGQYQTAIAVLPTNRNGIHVSINYGGYWAFKNISTSYVWNDVAMSADGRYQAATIRKSVNPGYIILSTDYGNTWTTSTNNAGDKYWEYIAMSADGMRLSAVPYNDYVYTSNDYGITWNTSTAGGIRQHIKGIAMSADGKHQSAVYFNDYIYTSDDYGITWNASTDSGIKNWQEIKISADGKRQIAITDDEDEYIYASNDYGFTWSKHGLADRWSAIAMLPGGETFFVLNNSRDLYTMSVIFNSGLKSFIPVSINTTTNNFSLTVDGNSFFTDQIKTNRGIIITSNTPAATLNALYNQNGILYWNGSPIGSGGGSLPSGLAGQILVNDGTTSWVTSSAIYVNNITGYIGIGTTSPSSLLTIGNNAGFQVNSTGDLISINGLDYNWPASQGSASTTLINDGTGKLIWGYASTTAVAAGGLNTQIQFNSSNVLAGDSNFIWDNVNKRLGIGTSTPLNALSVVGGINLASGTPSNTISALYNVGGSLYWNGAEVGSGGGGLPTGSTGQTLVNTGGTSWTPTSTLFVNSSGVSIGTSATSTRRTLSVHGDAIINNQLISNQEGGIYFGRTKISENIWAVNTTSIWATSTLRTESYLNIPFSSISMSSDGKYQIATAGDRAYSEGPVYVSKDYGVTWKQKYDAPIGGGNRKWTSSVVSADGKYQTITLYGGNIYVSTDYGESWVTKESVASWMSVAMSSDGKYQTALIYATNNISVSTDYGNTWTRISPPTLNNRWDIAMSSDGKYQTFVVIGTAIYVSNDYGVSWGSRVSGLINWRTIAMSSDGKYQTAAAEGGYIYVSSDSGNTWNVKLNDYTRNWSSVAISSDGKYQTAVVGSTDYAYVSSDYGNTWFAQGPLIGGAGAIAMSSDGKTQTMAKNGGLYTSNYDSYVYGNIGINTSTPGSALTIDGSINITGEYLINGLPVGGGSLPSGLAGQILVNDGTTSWVTSSAIYVNNITGYIGIGTTSPSSLLTIGNNAGFQVNSTGDLISINGLDYNWPASQGSASTTLINDGTGKLIWGYASTTAVAAGGLNTQIQFNSSDVLAGDSNFIWDNVNKRLGIGTATPLNALSVFGGINLASGTPSNTISALYNVDGALYWNGTAVGSGGGGTPAGSDGEIQFNDSGSFGATSSFFWDKSNGRLGIGTSAPTKSLHIQDGGILVSKVINVTLDPGPPPYIVPMTTTLLWDPDKVAFRVGGIINTGEGEDILDAWDEGNLGFGSMAFGANTLASGMASFAAGINNRATEKGATVFGLKNVASGLFSFVAGWNNTSSATSSFVVGEENVAQGTNSFVAGKENMASGYNSFVSGYNNIASGLNSFVSGYNNIASGLNAFSGGAGSQAIGESSFAFGVGVAATGTGSMAMGTNVNVTGNSSFALNVGSAFGPPAVVTTSNVMVLLGGNVGVGTVNPTSALTVSGSIDIIGVGGFKINGSPVVSSQWTTNGSNIYYNTGNVGIGTNTPSTLLTISGNGSTDFLKIGTSLNNNYFIVDKNGNLMAGTTTPSASFTFVSSDLDGLQPVLQISDNFKKVLDIGSYISSTYVIGRNSSVLSQYAYVFGEGANIGDSSGNSIALGSGSKVINSSAESAAIGYYASINNSGASYAFGSFANVANGDASYALGRYTTSTGIYSYALGYKASTDGTASYSLGATSSVLGNYSYSLGTLSNITGDQSFALGYNMTVDADNAFGLNLSNYPQTISDDGLFSVIAGKVAFGTTTPNSSGAYFTIYPPGYFATETPALDVYGQIRATGFITGEQTLDLAEKYSIEPNCQTNNFCPEAGDLVCIDENSTKETVKKCTGAESEQLVGVISTNPGFVLGGLNNSSQRSVALSGRVPVKVTNENGNIKIGDRLAMSKIQPGYAKKADDTDNQTIGLAMDSLMQETGTVITFLNLNYNLEQKLTVESGDNNIVYTVDMGMDISGRPLLNVASIVGVENKWEIDATGLLKNKISTSEGDKEIYSLTSENIEITLSGNAQLQNGEAMIVFATSTSEIIDESQPMKVSITLTADEPIITFVKEKSARGFTVKQTGNGISSATFDWIVIAKRKFVDPFVEEIINEEIPSQPSSSQEGEDEMELVIETGDGGGVDNDETSPQSSPSQGEEETPLTEAESLTEQSSGDGEPSETTPSVEDLVE